MDQTDQAATDSSSNGLLGDLSSLASSVVNSSAVQNAFSSVVSGAIAPTPSPTAQAATPQAVSHSVIGSIGLPVLLVGGAVVAFLLLKR